MRTHTYLLLRSSFVLWALGGAAHAQQGRDQSANDAGRYKLVWADEFHAHGPPDPRNWDYERGFMRNEELQWYQPENARCENGTLMIEARREQVANPRYDPQSSEWRERREFAEYTSASLATRGLHHWRYGRFVMRGRIDTRAGLWPAWWTLGNARRWPGGGEIDIMEFYRGTLLANVAWLGDSPRTPRWNISRHPIAEFGDPKWCRKFHVWRMDWNQDAIMLYLDEKLLNAVKLDQTINGDDEAANPFHEPHYMLLSLAVGGRQGGDPSATRFPARFEVDYVRVYRRFISRPDEAGSSR
jgi:beta-glucanase (GH16 family)